jgi:hypothetical protein
MSYEDAVKRWAGGKFQINPADISRVEIEAETRNGGYCETCEYEYAVIEVTVYGYELYEWSNKHDPAYKRIATAEMGSSFTELLKELIEA